MRRYDKIQTLATTGGIFLCALMDGNKWLFAVSRVLRVPDVRSGPGQLGN